MLDFDLAAMYQVETRVLKQAVRRNAERFPEDFLFETTDDEYNSLGISVTSQFVISNDRGGRRYMPFAFTEQGVAMLASVLRSPIAVQVSISIMRAFVQMRNVLIAAQDASAEMAELRARLQLVERDNQDNLVAMNDMSADMRRDIDAIYEAIGALSVKLPEARKPRQKIGFKANSV